MICVSCGDNYTPDNNEKFEVQDAMRARCKICSYEILGLMVPKFKSSFQFDTGGGQRVIRESKTH